MVTHTRAACEEWQQAEAGMGPQNLGVLAALATLPAVNRHSAWKISIVLFEQVLKS